MGMNAELVRSFYEAWNRRAFADLGAMLSPDVEWYDVARAEAVRGREATRSLLGSLAEAFPAAWVELGAVHEVGDVVVAECTYTRTAGGRWPRRPTTCDVIELSGGLIVRGRTYADAVRTALDLGAEAQAADAQARVVARVA